MATIRSAVFPPEIQNSEMGAILKIKMSSLKSQLKAYIFLLLSLRSLSPSVLFMSSN